MNPAWGWLALGRQLCKVRGVETEIDLRTADRDTLSGSIIRQQAIMERLEQRAQSKGSGRMPGLQPATDRKPASPGTRRKGRPPSLGPNPYGAHLGGWITCWSSVPTAVIGCPGAGPGAPGR